MRIRPTAGPTLVPAGDGDRPPAADVQVGPVRQRAGAVLVEQCRQRGLVVGLEAVGQSLRQPCEPGAGVPGGARMRGRVLVDPEVPLGDDASADSVEREIIQTETLLADLQAPTKLFRPFGGGGNRGGGGFGGGHIGALGGAHMGVVGGSHVGSFGIGHMSGLGVHPMGMPGIATDRVFDDHGLGRTHVTHELGHRHLRGLYGVSPLYDNND